MSVVLDASALLAYLQREPGANAVRSVISESAMSTVNWAEVVQKVSEGIEDMPGLRGSLESLGLALAPFTATQAEIAGKLRNRTRELGLSLGDRACLALGLDREATVYTADRVWKRLRLETEIRVIR